MWRACEAAIIPQSSGFYSDTLQWLESGSFDPNVHISKGSFSGANFEVQTFSQTDAIDDLNFQRERERGKDFPETRKIASN